MIKVLNLYAGIGGNRKYWTDVKVTAIENDPIVAKIYQSFYPKDNMVLGNAHQYLLDHFKEFDFIWSSAPCFTHSRARKVLGVGSNKSKPVYIDMTLWQEILFLKHHFEGNWVVENVLPYYKPLVLPTFKCQRHRFWSNYYIPEFEFPIANISTSSIPSLQKYHGINLDDHKIPGKDKKRKLLRNCVYPPLGLHIYENVPSNRNKQISNYQTTFLE
jgi:DNA (cytosine-5)-methyltransferase 1